MVGRRWAAAVVACGLVAGACASESETPLVLDGDWERTEVWERRNSFDYDQVATNNSPDAVAWMNRSADDPSQLAYWEIRDGGDPTERALTTPTDSVVIPVGVASDGEGWAAVAITRDQPRGANTGLIVWQGRTGRDNEPAAAQPITPPSGLVGAPESVSVGRSADSVVAAALYEGEPVVWARASNDDVGAWQSREVTSDLGLDDPAGLESLRIVGDGERLVLAGVGADGKAALWVSDDAASWTAVGGDDLPDSAGAVGLLTAVKRGRVAVGWLGEDETTPWDATEVTVQQLEGDELTPTGAVEAASSERAKQIHLTSATLSPDGRLVVVGGVSRTSGDRNPMVWAWHKDDEEWLAADQESLTGHLDHEFRAIVGTTDDRMVAVAAALSHPDVETWEWRADG